MQPVFDGHNDALTAADHDLLAQGKPGGHLDLPRMRAGGMRGGIFAVFVDSPDSPLNAHNEVVGVDGAVHWPLAASVGQPVAAAQAAAAAGRLLALERAGEVRVARTIADLDQAREHPDGPPVAVLHLEGAEPIDAELEALDFWYGAGLRSLGPVWSRSNAFAHGVPFIFPSSPDTGPGLTEAGVNLVKRCAELGIAVDLSHLNEAGFWDIAKLEVGPLIASHSGAHALAAASRNLTDKQLDAIKDSDGLVGIVYSCSFLNPAFDPEAEHSDLALIARHARYVADRIGHQHVALGSDFDGTTLPAELQDVTGLPRLLATLATAGFTTAEIDDIAWNNWRRVLDAWWH